MPDDVANAIKTRDDVSEHACEVSSQSVKKRSLQSGDAVGTRTNEHTNVRKGRSLYILRRYNKVKGLGRKSSYLAGFPIFNFFFFNGSMERFNQLA